MSFGGLEQPGEWQSMAKMYGAEAPGVKLSGVEAQEGKLSDAGEQEVKHDVRFPVQAPKHLPARAG